MTRKSTLALVTLFAGLLSLASVATVSANAPCTGYAQEHCEQVNAAKDALLFQTVEVTAPVHILSGNGMGQEHFEALTVGEYTTIKVAAKVIAPVHILSGNGMGQEHYEAMTSK
ncbi:MAG: hypothetical protein ACYDAR_16070 [Thermomicrobiales bacterium]